MQDSEDEEELPDVAWRDLIPIEIKLSQKDWDAFMELLENPPDPSPKLVAAVQEARRRMEKKNV
jgi:hypothetical protein